MLPQTIIVNINQLWFELSLFNWCESTHFFHININLDAKRQKYQGNSLGVFFFPLILILIWMNYILNRSTGFPKLEKIDFLSYMNSKKKMAVWTVLNTYLKKQYFPLLIKKFLRKNWFFFKHVWKVIRKYKTHYFYKMDPNWKFSFRWLLQ